MYCIAGVTSTLGHIRCTDWALNACGDPSVLGSIWIVSVFDHQFLKQELPVAATNVYFVSLLFLLQSEKILKPQLLFN